MADLDQLDIQIGANASKATKALDGLISQLGRLNESLDLGNLTHFTDQLKSISQSASGLKDVAANIRAVANAGSSLAKLTGYKTLNDQMRETENEAKKMAKSVADSLNFDSTRTKDYREAVKSFQEAINDQFSLLRSGKQEGAFDEIYAGMIGDLQKTRIELDDTYEAVKRFVESTTLHVDTKTFSDIASAYESIAVAQKRLGGKIELGESLKTVSEYFEELGQVTGKWINSGRSLDAIQELIDYIENGAQDISDTARMTQEDIERDFKDRGARLANAVRNFFDQSQVNDVKNPFDGIVTGLQSLQGITLPDFSQLGVLADNLVKLNGFDSKQLKSISKALSSVQNVGNVNINLGGDAESVAQVFGTDLPSAVQEATADIVELNDNLAPVMENLLEVASEAQNVTENFEALSDAFGELSDARFAPIISPSDADMKYTAENIAYFGDAFQVLEDIPSHIEVVNNALRDTENIVGETADHAEDAGEVGEDAAKKPQRPTIDLLASLVALGHEIGNIANAFDKLGDRGIQALKWMYKPVELVAEEYKERLSTITGFFTGFADKAKKSIDNLARFWKRSMKTFTFMLVRKAITAVLNEINDATESLAKWSKLFGTTFNDSMSQITSNLSYMARSIVGAFEPLINAVVPIINALSDAVANAAARLGEFFAALTGQGYYMQAVRQVTDYADSVDKANKAQKNLISGLDDLNIITTPTSTASGMDDLADQWKKVDVSDTMKDWAQAVKDVAKRLFDPIKKAWDEAGDHVIDGFKYMIGEIAKLGKSIGRDFMIVWEQPNTEKIFENLLHAIGYIEEGIGNIARNFREAWDEADKGLHILENLRDIVLIVSEHVKNMAKTFRDWADDLNFNPILASFENFTKAVQPLIDFLGNIIEDIWERIILRHWKWWIEEGAPHLLDTISRMIAAFNFEKIRKDLQPVMDAFETMRENIDTGLVNALGNLGERVAAFANSEDFTKFTQNVAWFMEQITAERVEKLFTALGDAVLNVAEALMRFVGSDSFKDFIQMLWDWYDSKSAEDIANIITRIAVAIAAFKFTAFVGKGLEGFIQFLSVVQSIKGIGGILGSTAEGVGALGSSAAIGAVGVAAIATAIYSMVESFGGLGGLLEELKTHFDNIRESIGNTLDRIGMTDSIDRLVESFKDLFKAIGDQKALWQTLFAVVEVAIEFVSAVALPVIQTLVDMLTGFNEIITGIWELLGGFFEVLHGFFTGDTQEIAGGWSRMCEGIVGAARGMIDFLLSPVEGIKHLVESIVGFFADLKYRLIGDPIVLDLVDGIIGAFVGMAKDVIESVDKFIDDVIGFFTNLMDKALELFQNLKEKAIEKFKAMKDKVIEKAQEMKTKVLSKITELKNDALNRFNTLKEEAVAKFESLKNEAVEKFNRLKDDAINAFNNLKTNAESAFSNMKTTVVGIAGNIAEDVSGKFWDMASWAQDAFWNVVDSAGSILGNLGSTISGAVGDLWSTAKGWGSNILSGLQSGIENSSGIQRVQRSVGLAVDAVKSTWQTLTRTHSPSKLFEDYGEYLVEGLNLGIAENIDSSKKTVNDWFNKISSVRMPTWDYDAAIPKNNLKTDVYNHSSLSGAVQVDNSGIEQSVRQGVTEAVGSLILPYLNSIAESSRTTANKKFGITQKEVGQAAAQYSRDYYMRTGRAAYGTT